MSKEKERQKIINRLKTIRGHINGIEKMIEEEKECIEILHQMSAIKSSVDGVRKLIVKNYAIECALKEDQDSEKMEEVMKTILKYID